MPLRHRCGHEPLRLAVRLRDYRLKRSPSQKFRSDQDGEKKWTPKGNSSRRCSPVLKKLPLKYIHAPWKAPEAVLKKAGIRLGQKLPPPGYRSQNSHDQSQGGGGHPPPSGARGSRQQHYRKSLLDVVQGNYAATCLKGVVII